MRNESIGYLIHPKTKELLKLDMNLEQCLTLYEQKQKISDDFFIFGSREYPINWEATRIAPALYHLFDFRADQGLRGLHTIIETRPYETKPYSSKAIKINLNRYYGASFIDKVVKQYQPKQLSDAIKFIESKLIIPTEVDKLLFTNELPGETFYFHALVIKLDEILTK